MTATKAFYKWFYDSVQSRYYNLLMKWCFFPLGGEQNVRRQLLSGMSIRSGEKILDMCCGTGSATFAMAERCDRSTEIQAIDLSTGQIRVAKNKNPYPNIFFQTMDATATSFADEQFDRVIIPHALHEMDRLTRITVLKEALRILKKGGTLVILEMDNPSNFKIKLLIGFFWFYWLPFNLETPTRRDMLKQGLRSEIAEAGFVSVKKTNLIHNVFQVIEGRKAGEDHDG